MSNRTSHNFKDLTGISFNKLTVLSRCENGNRGQVRWLCLCECGNVRQVLAQSLIRNTTRSCGCLQRLETSNRFKKHGFTIGKRHPLIGTWSAMINRTENPNYAQFKHYGGRGISVCERWRNSFVNFLEDMGDRPSPRHSLDRIDNNGHYCKENCRWATREQQSNNRRSNVYLTVNGETKSLVEWSRIYNIPRQYVTTRLHLGWSPENALKREVKRRKNKSAS